eukprot:GHVP01051752.1.p1 GENE.GHVP01051752.1~~GHVP01051752.1.p1  ORF type:complete len:758 (-),score=103.89 GHVP01051752.1:651-2924(-)
MRLSLGILLTTLVLSDNGLEIEELTMLTPVQNLAELDEEIATPKPLPTEKLEKVVQPPSSIKIETEPSTSELSTISTFYKSPLIGAVYMYLGAFTILFIAASCLEWMMTYSVVSLPISLVIFLFSMLLSQVVYMLPLARDSFLQQSVMWLEVVNPEVFTAILLPICLYQSAVNLNTHVFTKVLPSGLLLALPGVGINIVLAAAFLVYQLSSLYDFNQSMLIGAVVSATDPVAVIASLVALRCPDRMIALVEAESLMNDGSAVVFFEVFRTVVTGQFSGSADAVRLLLQLVVLACVFGIGVGYLLYQFLGHAKRFPVLQVSLALAVLHFVAFAAEFFFHSSGILAVVFFGLTTSFLGKAAFTPKAFEIHQNVVDVLANYSNQGLFMVAGIISMRYMRGFVITAEILQNLILLFVALTVIRLIVVIIFAPFMNNFGYGLTWKEGVVMWWGGLRGAVAVALALILESEPSLSDKWKRETAFYISGYALLTLIVQGTTIELLYKALNPYPITKFRKNNSKKARDLVEKQWQEEVHEEFVNHWAFNAYEDILQVAKLAVPNLSSANFGPTGILEVKQSNIKKLFTKSRVKESFCWEMPSIENQVASRGSQLSFLGDLVPEAVQETFRRMTLDRTDETKSAKDIKTEIATISLYRILGMYDNFHNHHYFSGEVLLKLRKAIDVAVDFAEGIPYGEASSPYVAEWHSIRSHIADFGNSLTPIDFNTVRETVAMLVFFVEAHQKLLSEEREWQEKNKGENNHSFE